jgi:hemolysin activation/secretion protein
LGRLNHKIFYYLPIVTRNLDTRTFSYLVIPLRSQFKLGIGGFHATINSDTPNSRFFSWQGQAQWARLLAPETLLIVRANTQIASISLLPLEQFGVSGMDSLRGY